MRPVSFSVDILRDEVGKKNYNKDFFGQYQFVSTYLCFLILFTFLINHLAVFYFFTSKI